LGVPVQEMDQKGQGVHTSDVPSCFVALGHQHIGSRRYRLFRSLQALYLAHNQRARVFGLSQPGFRVNERKSDYRNSLVENGLKIVGQVCDHLSNESYPEGLIRLGSDVANLLENPVGTFRIDSAEAAEASRL